LVTELAVIRLVFEEVFPQPGQGTLSSCDILMPQEEHMMVVVETLGDNLVPHFTQKFPPPDLVPQLLQNIVLTFQFTNFTDNKCIFIKILS
jgi:hypothetical protein